MSRCRGGWNRAARRRSDQRDYERYQRRARASETLDQVLALEEDDDDQHLDGDQDGTHDAGHALAGADDDDDDAIIEQWLRTAMPALVRSTETSPHRRALIHREKACAGERKPEGCGCGGVAACAAGARATEER